VYHDFKRRNLQRLQLEKYLRLAEQFQFLSDFILVFFALGQRNVCPVKTTQFADLRASAYSNKAKSALDETPQGAHRVVARRSESPAPTAPRRNPARKTPVALKASSPSCYVAQNDAPNTANFSTFKPSLLRTSGHQQRAGQLLHLLSRRAPHIVVVATTKKKKIRRSDRFRRLLRHFKLFRRFAAGRRRRLNPSVVA